jgi:putative phosphoribosyl transferase
MQVVKDNKKRLVIVPGATHLFEEPGKLEEVAGLAADWFGRYLRERT